MPNTPHPGAQRSNHPTTLAACAESVSKNPSARNGATMAIWATSGTIANHLGTAGPASSRQSYGAHGIRVESADAVRPILERFLRSPGVHLIEVPIDYSANQAGLIDDLQAIDCKKLGRPPAVP